jgi:hypothetical protein
MLIATAVGALLVIAALRLYVGENARVVVLAGKLHPEDVAGINRAIRQCSWDWFRHDLRRHEFRDGWYFAQCLVALRCREMRLREGFYTTGVAVPPAAYVKAELKWPFYGHYCYKLGRTTNGWAVVDWGSFSGRIYDDYCAE